MPDEINMNKMVATHNIISNEELKLSSFISEIRYMLVSPSDWHHMLHRCPRPSH